MAARSLGSGASVGYPYVREAPCRAFTGVRERHRLLHYSTLAIGKGRETSVKESLCQPVRCPHAGGALAAPRDIGHVVAIGAIILKQVRIRIPGKR